MNTNHEIYNRLLYPYEFAVLDNNCINRFAWRDESANLTETNERIWNALHILFQIWTPNFLIATVDSFTFGIPDMGATEEIVEPVTLDTSYAAIEALAQRTNQVLIKRQETHPDSPWGVSLVGPTLEGWMRLAIPSGARDEDPWIIAGENGVIAKEYELRNAPVINQLNTRWLRVKDINSSSDISFFVNEIGEVEVRLTLGLIVFNPANDIRPANTLVRGVPLAEWQDANRALLKHIFAELRQAGWEPTHTD